MAIYSEFSHKKIWFFIVMLVYQRVCVNDKNHESTRWAMASSSQTVKKPGGNHEKPSSTIIIASRIITTHHFSPPLDH